MNIDKAGLEELRLEIARAQVKRKDVAEKLGMTESRLSRILAGLSPAPADFKTECLDAIEIVQAADRAARAAWQSVMRGDHA